MKALRKIAGALLILIYAGALLADVVAANPYDEQFRDELNAPPSKRFPLGTDSLGRDRFSRLLHGIRISLLLAPAAALASTAIAAAMGLLAGHLGGLPDRLILSATDLFLSLPWLFLILTVRAALPLNVSPPVSVAITFTLLGLLGWASAARVVRAGVRSIEHADFMLSARASGIPRLRLLAIHVLPNLRPVLFAQFWISIPLFVISEADLGLLGLGVVEPLPSLGNLLHELINLSAWTARPWILAPAVVILLVVSCFHLALPQRKGAL